MSHVRNQIRDRAVTILTGLPTTGSNVFAARLYPLADSELPGLCIYTNSEEADAEQGKFDLFDVRRLTLSIEGFDKLTAGLSDKLDDIAAEVEDAIHTDPTFNNIAKTTDLTTVEYGKSAEGEQPIGMVQINFLVTYFINRSDSETPI